MRGDMGLGVGRKWGIAIGVFFTVMLIPVGLDTWHEPAGPRRIIAMVLLLAYAAVYLVTPSALWRRGVAAKLTGVTILLALVAGYVTVRGLPWLPLIGYAFAVAAVLLPIRWAAGVAAVVLSAAAVATVIWSSSSWEPWTTLLIIVVDLLLVGMLMTSNKALFQARHELAARAVSDERTRVARDLHDVLGHTLTTLTVKSALAQRLLGTGQPDRAGQELADIEHLSRQALVELRATVSGHRQVSLDAELAGARIALEAGQIGVRVIGDPAVVPAHLREPLAYVVREGVTNVLRHSGATICEIVIAPDSVEVTDDGRGGAAEPGNGLTGLRQRLAGSGGALAAGPADGGGFRLRAQFGAA
ncbi:two-component system sensor histidine kinase DesK [Hamadaea flava]|uniref:Sensor histidine kinase n=1 Tax=Hamadaea flava TaxID=1742688 RepID=A0ABV8LLA1_9ACTN|nr:histidine kinase [Hamadaea flava]MCP2324040.1 two-component system sensor histidine kinase DesK [Hamadaea flava]